ncbi:MAG: hypothetical protein ACE5ES_01540 [Candidatus Nanoarchaeia archaeon]
MTNEDKLGKIKSGIKKGSDFLESHIPVTTAYLIGLTPLRALTETGFIGMEDDISFNARKFSIFASYLGLGKIYDMWRNKTFKVLKVDKENMNARKYWAYDTLSSGTFGAVYCPLLYFASGSRDPMEIFYATAFSIATAAPLIGYPTGLAIDTFKDFFNIEESKRLPNFIKRQSSTVKKSLAGLITAGAIGATLGIYALTPGNGGEPFWKYFNRDKSVMEQEAIMPKNNYLEQIAIDGEK